MMMITCLGTTCLPTWDHSLRTTAGSIMIKVKLKHTDKFHFHIKFHIYFSCHISLANLKKGLFVGAIFGIFCYFFFKSWRNFGLFSDFF